MRRRTLATMEHLDSCLDDARLNPLSACLGDRRAFPTSGRYKCFKNPCHFDNFGAPQTG